LKVVFNEFLLTDGVVIDVEQTMAKSPNKEDFLLTEEDVTNWELKFGRVPEGSIIFMRSGWGSRWPNWESYYGTPSYNDTTKLHFPGYSASAAKFLVEDRTVAGLGIDTPSVDYGPSQDFKTHQVGLENDVFNLENVAGLKYIYSGVYPVVVLPVKIQGGSGAPARIFALIEGDLSSVRRNEAASHSSHDHDDNGDHDHDDDSYASHLGYNQLLLILMPVFVTAIFNLLN
jgi:kynurenine formamidase